MADPGSGKGAHTRQKWGEATLSREDIRKRTGTDQSKTILHEVFRTIYGWDAWINFIFPSRKHQGQLQAPHVYSLLSPQLKGLSRTGRG
jgi:hypothetical protein